MGNICHRRLCLESDVIETEEKEPSDQLNEEVVNKLNYLSI